ncbi:MAG: efflux RND transporter permease subunit [Candidatus Cloacimonetes bacterium]|nr:efflux RND transporter permease subunit [Candidatus Cloacimonadota bacterium]
MIAWFTRNSVAANLLMWGILASGLFSVTQLIPLEVFPNIETNRITVQMSLRGASPQDVEKGITIKIEESLSELEGIKEVTSVSSEGNASVSIEVESNYDARQLLADVRGKIDSINNFPVDAENATVSLAIRKRDVIVVTLSSTYNEMETREYAQQIRDDLVQIQGISQVQLTGVREFEISIEVSQDRLLQYGLTISDLSNAIKTSSLDLSSGNLKTVNGDILINLKNQAYDKGQFEQIPIKTFLSGSKLKLSDIATVRNGFEESPISSKFNNKNAVFIDVFRVGDESAIDVADKVKTLIQKKQSSLPEGFELSYWDDDSQIVKNRIETLLNSAVQGSILIILLLTLFLRPAIAIWVFVGIPISFMGAFLVMPYFGVTINVLSLFGFILVLGIVVDDAIVTGENIYSHLKKSESGEMAAINGTKEISTPVTFGVLTTVAAFLPLAFIEGRRAILFTQLPIVVVPVLIFSLIESKLILPSHLKHLTLRKEKDEQSIFEKFQHWFADGFENSILKYYQPILKTTLQNKATTLSLFVGTLALIIAFIYGGWIKFTFFPRIPSETIKVTLKMPVGTPFEVTHKHIEYISKKAEVLKDKYTDLKAGSVILNIMATTGGRGGTSETGEVKFEITPPEKRTIKIGSRELANEWRKLIGEIVGAESLAFRAERGRISSPINIQLNGSSIQALDAISQEIKSYLREFKPIFDITDSLSDGKEEIKLSLNNLGRHLGFSELELSQQVRQAVYGQQVQRIQRGRDDVRVMIRFPKTERKSISDLQNLLVTSKQGAKIPLGNIANLSNSIGTSSIKRINSFRTINIEADVEKNNINMVVFQKELNQYLTNLISKYPGITYTLEGEAREQKDTFSSLFFSLLMASFAIYTLLAIPFKSYVQPFIVMSVIPFGIIGAVMGHLLLGMNLTILSLMGMLALIGVVVNDSLVLVDYINKKYAQTNDLTNALSTAGAARFRPIMLTSLTTFFGLVPLLFEQSTQAQFLIPMATSLAFGVLISTFTTLIIIPVNYMIVEKAREWFKT